MGSSFLHLRFAFAAALSPGNRAKQRGSDHIAKAALGPPRMIFDLQHGRAGAAADELLKLEQLYPHFTCQSARTFELQPTFLFVVPQWSSKLKFKVVLALEILVVVNQVRDKAVAKMRRKQVLFKVIYLQWPVRFRNVCVRRK